MRWVPLAIILLACAAIGGFARYDWVTHGGLTRWMIAPVVMVLFVLAFAIFLTRGGSGPTKPGWT